MTDLLCLNCDSSLPGGELYCCELCKQTARTVRYVRAVRADGRIDDPEVAEAVQIKIASVLGGGYGEDERRLSPEQRGEVFSRDDWVCQVCGGKATEIDHIGAGEKDINEPANLQAICHKCHATKTKAKHRPVESAEEVAQVVALRQRIESGEPLRECDSADWDERWPGIKKKRRAVALSNAKSRIRARGTP